MRLIRFAVAMAGTALWLLLLAGSTLADGGPHVAAVNSGLAGLAADSCAGCHRVHSGQGEYLLRAPNRDALCLNCHNGLGATTDVVDGMQLAPSGWTGAPASDPVLGALRGGGFQYALIGSGSAVRLIEDDAFLGKVPVLATADAQGVTSTHLGAGTAWGNGPEGTSGAGAGSVKLECVSCHNPHGNGQYRILNPIPGEDFAGATNWYPAAPADAVEVMDVANPTNATRNYTVLPADFASEVTANGWTAEQGDYWRKKYPWNSTLGVSDQMQVGWIPVEPTNAAANGGYPVSNWNGMMTAWCLRCHTRYIGLNLGGEGAARYDTGDPIFRYRHSTTSLGCLQCHVSHGSNAVMAGTNGLYLTNPDGSLPDWTLNAGAAGNPVTSGDSRLLKVDGRGTCQLCHDPTDTQTPDSYTGPVPSPAAP